MALQTMKDSNVYLNRLKYALIDGVPVWVLIWRKSIPCWYVIEILSVLCMLYYYFYNSEKCKDMPGTKAAGMIIMGIVVITGYALLAIHYPMTASEKMDYQGAMFFQYAQYIAISGDFINKSKPGHKKIYYILIMCAELILFIVLFNLFSYWAS